MDFDITQTVAKLITELIDTLIGKEKERGKGFSKLYLKYSSMINFAIVFGIGMLIQSTASSAFEGIFESWIASPLAILSGLFWDYIMTVGPLGYIWGFQPHWKKQPYTETTKVEKVELKKKIDEKKEINWV